MTLPDLHSIPISDLISYRRNTQEFRPLLSVHEDVPLSSVLQTLRDNGILSVPVCKAAPGGGKEFTGIISVFDVMAWTVFQGMFDSANPSQKTQNDPTKLLTYAGEERFFATPVKELVGRARESKGTFMLKSTDSVASLVSLFTDGGYHRVLVIDEDLLTSSAQTLPSGSGILLITQMDLLKFFLQVRVGLQAKDLVALARQSSEHEMTDAEAMKKSVISVKDDSSALDAFRFMYTHRLTAVAIVNSDGCLVANLSASNLRGIHRGNIDTLLHNVYAFLEEHNKDLNFSDQLKTAGLDTNIDELVEMMLSAHIHRVWLTDDNDQPIGIVTCTDILRAFLPHAFKANA